MKQICPDCRGAGGEEVAYSTTPYGWRDCATCKGTGETSSPVQGAASMSGEAEQHAAKLVEEELKGAVEIMQSGAKGAVLSDPQIMELYDEAIGKGGSADNVILNTVKATLALADRSPAVQPPTSPVTAAMYSDLCALLDLPHLSGNVVDRVQQLTAAPAVQPVSGQAAREALQLIANTGMDAKQCMEVAQRALRATPAPEQEAASMCLKCRMSGEVTVCAHIPAPVEQEATPEIRYQVKQHGWASMWMDASKAEFDACSGEKRIAYLAPVEQEAAPCPRCPIQTAYGLAKCFDCVGEQEAAPSWPQECQWPQGKPFRVLKVGECGDHTPWQLVMPCGGILELNHHADDAVDEARAKWIGAALNLPQEDWAPYLKDDETPLARLQREIADSAALSSLLSKEREKNAASSAQVAPPGAQEVATALYWQTAGASGWEFKWHGAPPKSGESIKLYTAPVPATTPAEQPEAKAGDQSHVVPPFAAPAGQHGARGVALKPYRFAALDNRGRILAEEIGVHAGSMEEAEKKARGLMEAGEVGLEFRGNPLCHPRRDCIICNGLRATATNTNQPENLGAANTNKGGEAK